MLVFYIRCSTEDQNEARQMAMAEEHNAEKIFCEKVSGKDTNRPKLQELLAFVREGDCVYIHDFSRLARSTKDLLEILEELTAKGVTLISNKENLDTGTATGKLMLTVIAAINEFERQNLLERQKEGIEIAKKEGKFKGGQVKQIDDAAFNAAYEKYKNREINKAQFADSLKISRPTLDKLLKDKGLM
jgi:DNA invertase Pin-like site-specific DNA recombinase